MYVCVIYVCVCESGVKIVDGACVIAVYLHVCVCEYVCVCVTS